MAIRIKAKSFGPIQVRLGLDGIVLYGGEDGDPSPVPPHDTPVDLLLASLGACIAKSIEMAAAQDRQHLAPFRVEVAARKATDLPNRIGMVDIRIIGRLTEDDGLSARLVRKAKSICTVSNTLNCTINIDAGGSDRDSRGGH